MSARGEISGRHYKGASATREYSQPWECPNCGAKNHGRVGYGCPTCGVGVPPKAQEGQPTALQAQINAAVAAALRAAGVTPAEEVPDPEPLGSALGSSAELSGGVRAPEAEVPRSLPVPVAPLTLPDIDTSDPKVRLTIARALVDYANTWDGAGSDQLPEGCLDAIHAQALALQLAPELEGQEVEPSELEQEIAAEQAEVSQVAKADLLARLRAPNSK